MFGPSGLFMVGGTLDGRRHKGKAEEATAAGASSISFDEVPLQTQQGVKRLVGKCNGNLVEDESHLSACGALPIESAMVVAKIFELVLRMLSAFLGSSHQTHVLTSRFLH